MIERIVKDWLAGKLAVPVCLEVPTGPPASFVVVEKTGSGRKDYIDSATVAVKSYAETLYKAALLNEEVKAAMDSLPEHPAISAAKRNGDYPFDDTRTKRHRYQAVYDITYHDDVTVPTAAGKEHNGG